VRARCLLFNSLCLFLPKPAERLETSAGADLATGGPTAGDPTVLGTALPSAPRFLPTLPLSLPASLPPPPLKPLFWSSQEVAFCRALTLPRHCWGEQTASQPVKLYFLATCLKLQLPDMANEFYNQKLK